MLRTLAAAVLVAAFTIPHAATAADPALIEAAKLGTLAGSGLSVVAAFVALRLARPRLADPSACDEAEEVFGGNYPAEPELDELVGPAPVGKPDVGRPAP